MNFKLDSNIHIEYKETTKRLTLSQIAKEAKVSPQGLTNIVNGHRRPSWPMSQRLEKATGISAVDWIDGRVDRDYLEKNYSPDNSNYRRHEHRNSHADTKTGSFNETIQEKNVTG